MSFSRIVVFTTETNKLEQRVFVSFYLYFAYVAYFQCTKSTFKSTFNTNCILSLFYLTTRQTYGAQQVVRRCPAAFVLADTLRPEIYPTRWLVLARARRTHARTRTHDCLVDSAQCCGQYFGFMTGINIIIQIIIKIIIIFIRT